MGKPNSTTRSSPGGTAAAPVEPARAEGQKQTTDTPELLDGTRLRTLLAAGTAWLERNAAAVDALNVFPVPDGDTGKNMLLTMRAAVEGAAKAKSVAAAQVMRSAAQGAVMGARGNSGVILSQIVAGIARALGDDERCDPPTLATALAEGASTAYRAVTRPVEGTILTVARAAGEAAQAAVQQSRPHPTCVRILEDAVEAAQAAVRRTPEQLPILRQAGVVDAGGEGYRVILEGMLFALRGESLPDTVIALEPVSLVPVEAVGGLDLDAIPSEEWGYCTQFVISGDGLDLDHVRHELQELAESTLVVGDDTVLRVHGHTDDPGKLLSYAVRFGRLQRISIEDMDAQHDEWLRRQVETTTEGADGETAAVAGAAATEIATVAVAPGDGFGEVFRSLGTAAIVPGGQTMNPSAQDILRAAKRTGARTVVILPNNANVVMTAQQAAQVAEAAGVRLLVVPTRTVPQGIAAQLAFNPGAGAEANAAVMAEAATSVRTVEVTRATRTVNIDGVAVQAGQVIGLLDDKLVAADDDPLRAACRALDLSGAGKAELLTVYRGNSPAAAEAERFVASLREAYPKAEIEVVAGGQPHYDYVISVE